MEILQLVIPIVWTIMIIVSIIYVTHNKKFPVTVFDINVRVDTSPSLAWSKKKKGRMIIGILFLVVMWVMYFLVQSDTILLGGERSNSAFLIFIPAAISVIVFFSGYSSKLTNNYIFMPKNEFNSLIAGGFIEEKGKGYYVDIEGDKLLHSFDGKDWIQ